jgi:hypothetical protein
VDGLRAKRQFRQRELEQGVELHAAPVMPQR